MSSLMISFFLGAGIAGWSYSKLAKSTGNAVPRNNLIAAAVAGLVAAIVLFTILKFVIHF